MSSVAEFTSSVTDCSDLEETVDVVGYRLNVQEYQVEDSLEQLTGFPRDSSMKTFMISNLGKYVCVCVCACVCVYLLVHMCHSVCACVCVYLLVHMCHYI